MATAAASSFLSPAAKFALQSRCPGAKTAPRSVRFPPVRAQQEVKEEEPAACSCEEVKALSEELMAYESYMSFLGVPYMEGGAAAAAAPAAVGVAAEDAPAELWSFEDSYYPGPLGL